MTEAKIALLLGIVASATWIIYFLQQSKQTGSQTTVAPASNVNQQTLYSSATPIGQGGTTNGTLTQTGRLKNGLHADTVTLAQPNPKVMGGSNAPGYVIQTSAAVPYGVGPNTYYAQAYADSPPDPQYTANVLLNDPVGNIA
jgi:hypothetical protein